MPAAGLARRRHTGDHAGAACAAYRPVRASEGKQARPRELLVARACTPHLVEDAIDAVAKKFRHDLRRALERDGVLGCLHKSRAIGQRPRPHAMTERTYALALRTAPATRGPHRYGPLTADAASMDGAPVPAPAATSSRARGRLRCTKVSGDPLQFKLQNHNRDQEGPPLLAPTMSMSGQEARSESWRGQACTRGGWDGRGAITLSRAVALA